MADRVTERGGGLAAFDMIVLVGGTDVGPRTWVEQVGAPAPAADDGGGTDLRGAGAGAYLRTGQLVALLATVRVMTRRSSRASPAPRRNRHR